MKTYSKRDLEFLRIESRCLYCGSYKPTFRSYSMVSSGEFLCNIFKCGKCLIHFEVVGSEDNFSLKNYFINYEDETKHLAGSIRINETYIWTIVDDFREDLIRVPFIDISLFHFKEKADDVYNRLKKLIVFS